MSCIGGDPTCPCQDGDACHYRGPNAWPAPPWFRRLLMLDAMIDRGMYSRASGECECPVCGRIYYRHPHYTGMWQWGENWLTLLCDGRLVHL